MTNVLRVKKNKILNIFTNPKDTTQMEDFLKKQVIEIRITVGKNWNHEIFSAKGPYLNKLAKTIFKRGSEVSYSRNVIMFNDDLQSINARVSFGVCKDFETEVHNVELKRLDHPCNRILMAPSNYFNPTAVFN